MATAANAAAPSAIANRLAAGIIHTIEKLL
jgi:hypothetical protein